MSLCARAQLLFVECVGLPTLHCDMHDMVDIHQLFPMAQRQVEATVEEAKLRHALRAVMTEMEELDSEKTAEMQRAREQVGDDNVYFSDRV